MATILPPVTATASAHGFDSSTVQIFPLTMAISARSWAWTPVVVIAIRSSEVVRIIERFMSGFSIQSSRLPITRQVIDQPFEILP